MTKTLAFALVLAIMLIAAPLSRADDANMDMLMNVVRTVTLTRYVNGVLTRESTTRDHIARCCPTCVNLDGHHYYDSLRTVNRDLANDCASHSKIGTVKTVTGEVRELCKKKNKKFLFFNFDRSLRYTNPVRYRVSRQSDGIHLNLKVRINVPNDSTPSRKTELLNQTLACIPKLRSVWARYGIMFDLAIDSNASQTPGSPDQQVNVVDKVCRSDSSKFCFLGQTPNEAEADREDEFCLTLLHETGHHLGLDDEYADKDCPDRPYVSKERDPWDVMAAEYYGWDNIEFWPRHVMKIIRPLCE